MGLIIPVVLLGLLASLSPSTIVVFILLLATTRARVNAAAFLIGWSVSLVVVFGVSYAIGSARPTQHGSGRTVVDLAEALLGLALVGVGVRTWGRRNLPRASSGASKGLTDRMRKLNPWGAAMVGVLKQPWVLTAAAAALVVRHESAAIVALIAFVLFTVVSTATVGLIFLYYARRPGEAEARLAMLRDQVVKAGPALFAAVSVLVGLFLMSDGLLGLVTS